jgi:hypothetical protein
MIRMPWLDLRMLTRWYDVHFQYQVRQSVIFPEER